MNSNEQSTLNAFLRLSRVLDILRQQCPWDSVQTISSLRYLTIEEVYELSDAILQLEQHEGDHQYDNPLMKELGDLFMHLLFYAKIANDEHRFTPADVLHSICDKLLSRHPHIALPDREGVMQGGPQNPVPEWEKVKMKEGRKSVLEGVPNSLPSLVKAQRMQEKAMGVGFKFPDSESAFRKVEEEYEELRKAVANPGNQQQETPSHVTEEFGDLLFALIVWSHFLGVNADEALSLANQKFQRRFSHIEEAAKQKGTTIDKLSIEEMRHYWKEAKQQELP